MSRGESRASQSVEASGAEYARGRRSKDSLSLYMKYRDSWDKHKPPGTDSRLKLRWNVREQLNPHDEPASATPTADDKHKKTGGRNCAGLTVNTYVVPTDKYRMQLRWQIRQDLAKGVVPTQTCPLATASDTDHNHHRH